MRASKTAAAGADGESASGRFDAEPAGDERLVLYPHFQRAVVPGWLDKSLLWRHRATPKLERVLLLAPNPDWVRTLPGAKLPDRSDLQRLAHPERVRAWRQAVAAAQQLAEEFETWLGRPDPARLQPL